jgi:hypothetical protein
MKELYTKYKKQGSQFKDTTDLFTSFVFNLMANSITIKTLTQNMVTYANKNQWESYTLSLG